MPTDKDLIKDTIAVGGHYSNYSPGFIAGAQSWTVAACYCYRASLCDEAVLSLCVQRLSLMVGFLRMPWFHFILA